MFFKASGLWLFSASRWARGGAGSILAPVVTTLQRDEGCLCSKLPPGEEFALGRGDPRVTKSSSQIDRLHLR